MVLWLLAQLHTSLSMFIKKCYQYRRNSVLVMLENGIKFVVSSRVTEFMANCFETLTEV